MAETAVLIIHGFTANPRTVEHITHYITRAGLSYEIPTLRGHGTRTEDLQGLHWYDWLEDAENAFDRLAQNHQQIVVIGHSMGALLAGLIAMRKANTASLVMVAPALDYANPLAYMVPILGTFIKYWSWGPSSVTDPKLRAQSEAEHVTYARFPVSAFSELLKLRQVTIQTLPQVRVPAMVIQSRLDKSLPPASAQKAFALLGSQKKKIEWVERGGHEVFWDVARDEICQKIITFIQTPTF